MTNDESLIIDELYFVTSYQELLGNTGLEEELFNNLLHQLVKVGYVQQLHYNGTDFEKMDQPDVNALEEYSYLATKKALLAHNGLDI